MHISPDQVVPRDCTRHPSSIASSSPVDGRLGEAGIMGRPGDLRGLRRAICGPHRIMELMALVGPQLP